MKHRPLLFAALAVAAIGALLTPVAAITPDDTTPDRGIPGRIVEPPNENPNPPGIPADGDADRLRVEMFQRYADLHDITLKEATVDLQAQGEFADWATAARTDRAFAGAKIEHDTNGRSSAVVATVTNRKLTTSPPASLDVRTVEARFSETEFRDIQEDLGADLARNVPGAAAVTYDPFDDALTIWTSDTPQGRLVADQPDTRAAVDQALNINTDGLELRYQQVPDAELRRGGMKLDGPGPASCTTGFSVRRFNGTQWQYGYMTAGHCFGDGQEPVIWPWTVERHPHGNFTNIWWAYHWDIGGYQDRIIYTGAGISTYTRIRAAGNAVDMGSPVVHPLLGMYICWYGAGTLEWNCDNVEFVNVPVPVGDPVWAHTYTWVAEARRLENGVNIQTCLHGDSGGPMWSFVGTEFRITGHMVAGDNLWCYHVSADDNLRYGPGNWQLY